MSPEISTVTLSYVFPIYVIWLWINITHLHSVLNSFIFLNKIRRLICKTKTIFVEPVFVCFNSFLKNHLFTLFFIKCNLSIYIFKVIYVVPIVVLFFNFVTKFACLFKVFKSLIITRVRFLIFIKYLLK